MFHKTALLRKMSGAESQRSMPLYNEALCGSAGKSKVAA